MPADERAKRNREVAASSRKRRVDAFVTLRDQLDTILAHNNMPPCALRTGLAPTTWQPDPTLSARLAAAPPLVPAKHVIQAWVAHTSTITRERDETVADLRAKLESTKTQLRFTKMALRRQGSGAGPRDANPGIPSLPLWPMASMPSFDGVEGLDLLLRCDTGGLAAALPAEATSSRASLRLPTLEVDAEHLWQNAHAALLAETEALRRQASAQATVMAAAACQHAALKVENDALRARLAAELQLDA